MNICAIAILLMLTGCVSMSDDWVQQAFCQANWYLSPECWS